MGFNDLVAKLRDPGEDGVPESIYDDLTNEYNTAVEGAATRVKESEASLAAKDAEIGRLKATNFDLISNSGWSREDEKPDAMPDTQSGIDALFESVASPDDAWT